MKTTIWWGDGQTEGKWKPVINGTWTQLETTDPTKRAGMFNRLFTDSGQLTFGFPAIWQNSNMLNCVRRAFRSQGTRRVRVRIDYLHELIFVGVVERVVQKNGQVNVTLTAS